MDGPMAQEESESKDPQAALQTKLVLSWNCRETSNNKLLFILAQGNHKKFEP